MCAEFSGHAYSHGNCIGGNLVCFLDCLVRFKERKAVIELDVKSVFPVQVTRMLDRRPRRFPKGFLMVLIVFTIFLPAAIPQLA